MKQKIIATDINRLLSLRGRKQQHFHPNFFFFPIPVSLITTDDTKCPYDAGNKCFVFSIRGFDSKNYQSIKK